MEVEVEGGSLTVNGSLGGLIGVFAIKLDFAGVVVL